jgi:hypothetical protein
VNIKKLVQGLSYIGEVEGKRQTYYVFRAGDYFLVLSFSKTKPQAGNFNIVDAEAVEYLRGRLRGKKGVTSNDVVAKARRTRHAPSSLVALNILYVLVALGGARVDTRRAGPKLYFNLGRGRA